MTNSKERGKVLISKFLTVGYFLDIDLMHLSFIKPK